MFNIISNNIDCLNQKPYNLCLANVKLVSEVLKKTLDKKGIDYSEHNHEIKTSSSWALRESSKVVDNPPKEIYEYQNFFLLEDNREYFLLDGFRRLLWYNVPEDVIGTFRVYKKSDLSQTDILTLLVNLNHHKFMGLGGYYERGFSLVLESIFNINSKKLIKYISNYLQFKKTKRDYSSSDGTDKYDKNGNVKEGIINKNFISDISFIESLLNEDYIIDEYVCSLIKKYRNINDNIDFNFNLFKSEITKNENLTNLMNKIKNTSLSGSKKDSMLNNLYEYYENIFKINFSLSGEESFNDRVVGMKSKVKEIAKNKEYIKLTGYNKTYIAEMIMEYNHKKGVPMEFICVVHPEKNDKKIKEGVYTDVSVGLQKKNLGLGSVEIALKIKINDIIANIRHNYGGYYGYGKKYTYLEYRINNDIGHYKNDIDLFIKMDKELIKKVDADRQYLSKIEKS
jgi:hypothetical protein